MKTESMQQNEQKPADRGWLHWLGRLGRWLKQENTHRKNPKPDYSVVVDGTTYDVSPCSIHDGSTTHIEDGIPCGSHYKPPAEQREPTDEVTHGTNQQEQ